MGISKLTHLILDFNYYVPNKHKHDESFIFGVTS